MQVDIAPSSPPSKYGKTGSGRSLLSQTSPGPSSAFSRRISFKTGSPLAKADGNTVNAFVTKPELDFLRSTLMDLAGEPDSFHLRYRVIEAAAASPTCNLMWWPPTDDMLAIIEMSYRATLGPDAGSKVLSTSSIYAEQTDQTITATTSTIRALPSSPTPASSNTEGNLNERTDQQSNSVLEVMHKYSSSERADSPSDTETNVDQGAQNDSSIRQGSRRVTQPPSWNTQIDGALTVEAVSALYQQLVKHQKEQTLRFDNVIAKREEQRKIDEENEQIRAEAAERTRLEKEKKDQEELESALKKRGPGARQLLAQIRAKQVLDAANPNVDIAQQAKDASKALTKAHEKAWPGGILTRINLEAAFRDLPERPSGAQARYFYDRRSWYCDASRGQDYLATEGFSRLVRALGHLNVDLESKRGETLQKIFKKMDTRRKGEISLADILEQIETEERTLLMPMVDALLHRSDQNQNGLLDADEFREFHAGWLELHRIFEVYDDCRIEEKWMDLDHLDDPLSFAETELLSSVFQGIKSRTQQGRTQVAHINAVVLSLELMTANPSTEEIECSVAAVEVRSDMIDFHEFLEIHKKLRWLRNNPGYLPRRHSAPPPGNVNGTSPELAGTYNGRINHQTRPESRTSSSSFLKTSKLVVGPEARTQSHEDTAEAQRIEKLKADSALLREHRDALKKLHFFERRKQISRKASTMIIEAILNRPVENRGSIHTQQRRASTVKGMPTTQQRSARDVQELSKLFRLSEHFSDMSDETMTALVQRCTCIFAPSKSVICDLKDWGSGFWIIVVGDANVYMRDGGGKRQKVAQLCAGQSFGEMFLLFDEFLPRRFKVEACTDGVLAAFIDRDDYFYIGLDAYHRSSTWRDLSRKHTLLLQMPILSHLDPIEKFHLCYQLRECSFMARSELYNMERDSLYVTHAENLFRDSTVLQEKPDKHLYIVQEGTCDVWIDAGKEVKVDTGHERDLSHLALFSLKGEQPRLVRVSSLAAGAVFGLFATGPKVYKISASASSSVSVYTLRPEEALHRLRREGIQKIFQQRDSREEFIMRHLQEGNASQKSVAGFLKGERDLKELGTMLQNPMLPKQIKTHKVVGNKGSSTESVQSMDKSTSMDSMPAVKSQHSVFRQGSTAAFPTKSSRAVGTVGSKKAARCHIPNTFKVSEKDLDLVQIVSGVKKAMVGDTSQVVQRGKPPSVPGFSKTPDWLDRMVYRFSVTVKDPLHQRETEAQHKLAEAFLIYENWQNVGKNVDMHRFLELLKAAHLVGNPSDPRDNLLTSITIDDSIEVFKQVSGAAVPTASLLKGRYSTVPQFNLSRFNFSQCMHLVAARLRVSLPKIHNFPIDSASVLPVSNKATRVSLSGAESNMETFMAERLRQSKETVLQEQIDISQSGRPGSTAYYESFSNRPATSCGFVGAAGIKDGIGRILPRPGPDRPHSSLIKAQPSRPGSACVVSMLVSSAQDGKSRSPEPPDAHANEADPNQSVIDRFYSMPSKEGVLAHMNEQRRKRTRSIKRSLKRLRLPAGLQTPTGKPAEFNHLYQMLQSQLYGNERQSPSLQWCVPSAADQHLRSSPTIAQHEHLHSTPVFFSALSRPSVVAAQQDPPSSHNTHRPIHPQTLTSHPQTRPDSSLWSRPATSMQMSAEFNERLDSRLIESERGSPLGASSERGASDIFLERSGSAGSSKVSWLERRHPPSQ